MAHFLEHMLFLGTAKYPDENSYSSFLQVRKNIIVVVVVIIIVIVIVIIIVIIIIILFI